MPKEYNAHSLTELIKKYTRNDYLKDRIEYFGIDKFIDNKNKNFNDNKYRADVFEAIIGAVAIDCEFNEIKITNVVNNMIGIH